MAHARSRLNNGAMATQQVGSGLKELALATSEFGNVGPIQSTGVRFDHTIYECSHAAGS